MRLFEQDVREKRRIAAGAHHKKRRGRGCTLPSDCLTPTQLRRLNGSVRTYRLDQPLRYEAVLALPEDLRREYLVRLRDGYRADAGMLSEMLAVSRQRTEELLERFPDVDGIIACNDIVAISTYKVLHKRGISVPEKVQLIGFDDISFASLLSPELTTISQPVKEMAKKAVELIVNNELTGMTGGKFIFPVTLVARQTTKKKGERP